MGKKFSERSDQVAQRRRREELLKAAQNRNAATAFRQGGRLKELPPEAVKAGLATVRSAQAQGTTVGVLKEKARKTAAAVKIADASNPTRRKTPEELALIEAQRKTEENAPAEAEKVRLADKTEADAKRLYEGQQKALDRKNALAVGNQEQRGKIAAGIKPVGENAVRNEIDRLTEQDTDLDNYLDALTEDEVALETRVPHFDADGEWVDHTEDEKKWKAAGVANRSKIKRVTRKKSKGRELIVERQQQLEGMGTQPGSLAAFDQGANPISAAQTRNNMLPGASAAPPGVPAPGVQPAGGPAGQPQPVGTGQPTGAAPQAGPSPGLLRAVGAPAFAPAPGGGGPANVPPRSPADASALEGQPGQPQPPMIQRVPGQTIWVNPLGLKLVWGTDGMWHQAQ